MSCRGAEAKINTLYAEVLSACDWDDQDFVREISGRLLA